MHKAVVFDDEYIVIQGLQMMIDWSSYGIELAGTATDGNSALELFRTVRPDIVFTDIRMPGMDGLQLIEEIAQEAPDTYCVVFSGFNEFEYVKRAIKLGVVDYLEKPISIESVETALGKITAHVQEQREREALKQQLEEAEKKMQALSAVRLLESEGDRNKSDDSKLAPIDKIKTYIEQHFTRDLSLNELADYVGLNPAYVSVLFKETMGESYIKFLTRCRMEYAKRLLQQGAKVNEVSEKVGYHTYRHFSEVFKRYTGKTPGQYKEG
ncbi:response regulator transcription factor [Marinicrinis lubricantis]|uniref:Response regulator n=1 Tax=Marinicrinis lubricantis TaxID=2086470 RepID=A0ABW1IR20_9BACL